MKMPSDLRSIQVHFLVHRWLPFFFLLCPNMTENLERLLRELWCKWTNLTHENVILGAYLLPKVLPLNFSDIYLFVSMHMFTCEWLSEDNL